MIYDYLYELWGVNIIMCCERNYWLLWMLYCMLLMVRTGTISVVVVVALLCMSCIILYQCVERGESRVQKLEPLIIWGFEVGTPSSEVETRFEWGTIVESTRLVINLYVQIGTACIVSSCESHYIYQGYVSWLLCCRVNWMCIIDCMVLNYPCILLHR